MRLGLGLGFNRAAVSGGGMAADMWSPSYDTVTGTTVAGAWGLRRLVSSHTGAVVRVRDTADSSEQDVGLGEDGFLADFTVAGNAAVVTLYDQSGNGAHLTQSDTSRQPLIVRPGVSVAGRAAIRFDGSNDFLRDATTGTARPYMVSYPVIAVEAAGRNGGGSFAAFANIPHSDPNADPFARWSIGRNSTLSSFEFRLSGAASATTIRTMELNNGNSIGTIVMAAQVDRLIDGTGAFDGPRGTGDAVTYPNATSIRVGTNSNAEISAVVVLSDSAASISDIQGWHDDIHLRSLAIGDSNLVLDVSFASDPPADASDRAHPVWLSNGATVSSSRLDPSTAGAAVIAPSGLTQPTTGDFTAEVDIYLTSLAVNRRIFERRFGNTGWHLGMAEGSSDELAVVAGEIGNGGSYMVTSAANLTTGTWYTVRVTREGSDWALYVDGVERATATTPTIAYTARPLLVGNSSDRSLPFPGYIRNLKIWSGVALAP